MNTKLLLIVLLPLFTLSVIAQNTPGSCEGSLNYCFGDGLYNCNSGQPGLIRSCPGGCENAECIYNPLEPDIEYDTSKIPPVTGGDNNFFVYVTLGLVLLVSAFLIIRIKNRK